MKIFAIFRSVVKMSDSFGEFASALCVVEMHYFNSVKYTVQVRLFEKFC